MDISAVFPQVVILFAVLLLGFFAVRGRLLRPETNRVLADLVILVTNPCSILSSVFNGERTLTNSQVFLLTGVALGMFLLLILLSRLTPYLLRVPPEERGIYRFMTTFGNVSFLGYPVVEAVFGFNGIFMASIFTLFYQLFCFTYGVTQISADPRDAKLSLRMFCKPCVLAAMAAYVCYLLDLRPPAIVGEVFQTVGRMTSPAAMLSIGCGMAGMNLRGIFGQKNIYPLLLLKLVLAPLMVWALLRLVVTDTRILGVSVILAAMPVASNASLLCTQYERDSKPATAGVFLSTLASLVTLPFLLNLLFA